MGIEHDKCAIDNQSPSIWALQRIKEKLEAPLKSWQRHSRNRTASQTLIYDVTTGECFGDDKPEDVPSENLVVLAVYAVCDNNTENSNLEVELRSWKDNGSTSYKVETYGVESVATMVEELAPLVVTTVVDLVAFAQKDLYKCHTCEGEFKNPPDGRYFAGTFCKACWEAYKQKHSRKCGRCRRAMYECYC